MTNTKKLNFTIPAVTCYPRHSFSLTVLSGSASYLPWLYGNYIQLFCNADKRITEDWFEFYTLDPQEHFNTLTNTSSSRITRDIIQTLNKNIIELVIDALRLDYYVIVYLDEFYTPPSQFYAKKHRHHGILLYGYDLEQEVFEIAGYYENQRYKSEKLRFSDFELAYEHAAEILANDPVRNAYLNVVHLLKVDTNTSYPFNVHSVLDQLNDYLFSRSTNERFRMIDSRYDGVYGLSVYPYISSVLERLLKASSMDRAGFSDHRPLFILLEHKRLMISRIYYMKELGYLDDVEGIVQNFREIEADCLFMLNQFGKFLLKGSRDDGYIENVISTITLTAEKERLVLERLIQQLNNRTGCEAIETH